MSAPDQGPLTDEEIQELDQFLLDAEGIKESMNEQGGPQRSLPLRVRQEIQAVSWQRGPVALNPEQNTSRLIVAAAPSPNSLGDY